MAAKSDNEEPKVVAVKSDKTSGVTTGSSHHPSSIMVLGGVLAIFFILFVGIGIAGWRHTNMVGFRTIRTRGVGQVNISPVGRFGGQAYANGPINSSDEVNGTVTAVNGTSFTVASYGSSTTVQTNSSTQYQDGNTVKVNDTVTAEGTTSNGTLTATLVVINP